MRIQSKSAASTFVKKKHHDKKLVVDLAKTNGLTVDDLKLDETNSDLGSLSVKQSNLIPRTRSANYVNSIDKSTRIKKFIKKSIGHVNMNSHFQIENSANVKSVNHQFSDSSTSMERGETSRKSPIDKELRAYVSQKKNIREKIQDHWKLELNAKSIQKTAPMNIINDEIYKPDQQWINISISSNQRDTKTSLIDTFTADLDKASDKDTYKVSGDVGSVIAQKLISGEQMRICRNGQPVHKENFIEDSNDSTTFVVYQQPKKKEHSTFFSDIQIPRNSILSWKDQVQKQNIRIIEPSVAEIKNEPERRLIVKKLVDEEQYKPKSKKSIYESKEYKESLNTSPRRQITMRPVEVTRTKTPVEVVGFSRKTTQIEPETKVTVSKDEQSIDPDEIFTVRLTPAKSIKTNGKLYENLSEKNYDEMLGNLTNRFNNEKSQDFNDLLMKKSKKVNLEKRKHVSFNNDSKFNYNSKDTNLKLLEKKYKKLINNNSFNIGNISSSNSRCTPNFDPNSQILKNLSLSKTNSSYESHKIKFNNPQFSETVKFRINSIADGLHELDIKNYVPKTSQAPLKHLNTVLTETTNSKIYSS